MIYPVDRYQIGHWAFGWLLFLGIAQGVQAQEIRRNTLDLRLRFQTETSDGSERYHRLERSEQWNPTETALIVCDVWDSHHCHRAVLRVQEMAPRLEKVLQSARTSGVTIIHAPSGCMDFYADQPARRRAQNVERASAYPDDIQKWCYQIPSEEKGEYPIDQSDGGEDDDPDEHAEWAKHLEAISRNPRAPWQRQVDILTIDQSRDYISDRGDEIWNILSKQGIKNVILAGVHTNMCVLGRPFGLRQMVRAGKNTVLMRDMTDTMYNPASRPYVSHFSGTDLIVDHIEKFVCPTITSDQFLGGQPFHFEQDNRAHIGILMAESEYETEKSLPKWADSHLRRDYRVSLFFGSDTDRNSIPGVELLREADVLIVSVRRRVLPAAQLDKVKAFVAAGKSVIGIRTASHAFSLRNEKPADGLFAWPEFDANVFGGNYTGHHKNSITSRVRFATESEPNPLLRDVKGIPFTQHGSLYQVSPLAKGTQPLLIADIEGAASEPVAWTYLRRDGGKSFYTSLGHPEDAASDVFQSLLLNAVRWSLAEKPKSTP